MALYVVLVLVGGAIIVGCPDVSCEGRDMCAVLMCKISAMRSCVVLLDGRSVCTSVWPHFAHFASHWQWPKSWQCLQHITDVYYGRISHLVGPWYMPPCRIKSLARFGNFCQNFGWEYNLVRSVMYFFLGLILGLGFRRYGFWRGLRCSFSGKLV